MNSNRATAILVGVLYIIGTASGVMALVSTKPVLDAPDYLVQASTAGSALTTGALLILVMGLSLATIPVLMFSILKRQNEALALGYVVFRGALETVTYVGVAMCWLLLVSLSQAYVQGGSPAVSAFGPLGATLLKGAEASSTTTEIVFPIGALMFNYMLYRSKLIPRWISGWGFIAAIPSLAAGFLHLFGATGQMSTLSMILELPTAPQEMVMAVWMIVKGFNSSALASLAAKTATN